MRLAHRGCRDKRSAYRLNAIILLSSGWTVQEVADALLIDEGTLRKYVDDYHTGGIDQLLATHYQGGLSYLDEQEKQALAAHLSTHTYSTTREVIRYVEQEYEVVYSVSGMTDLLHALGFSYKKPKVVPGKTDRDAQESFISAYRERKETKSKDDPIYFMDGVHPQHNTQAGYGWIKRGEEKAIPSNSGRQRLNINGALNIDEMQVSIVIDKSVNADSTIELLKQLEDKHLQAEKIYIVCDNARYYRSRKVKAYVSTSKIELCFLPPYSPNLNLIERYWKYFKREVVRNCYYETFTEFRESCESFFTDIDRHKEALRSLLTENFHLFSPTDKIRKTYS